MASVRVGRRCARAGSSGPKRKEQRRFGMATCTMNFAVSAWQSADAWACEPTKRHVAESAESAAVGMCMVAALVAAGFVQGVGTAPLLSPEQARGQIEVPATILSNTNRWQLIRADRPIAPAGVLFRIISIR